MGDNEALADESSWLPAVPGHCVCSTREHRACSVNRGLLFFPPRPCFTLSLSLSRFPDHLRCFARVVRDISLTIPVDDCTGGGHIFNHT